MSMTNTEHFLDITDQVCPMTFVRTKLLIEKMSIGDTALVRLNAGEPLRNVPRSVKEHGHKILYLEPENKEQSDGPHMLKIQKSV